MKNIVTRINYDVSKAGGGLAIQRTITYVESSFNSGATRKLVERYDYMTDEECNDLLEALIGTPAVGDEIAVHGGHMVVQGTLDV